MKPKKIFILLPDGIGLRNFAFTSFVKLGEQRGWKVIFWNQTPFDLQALGYKEIKLYGKPRPKTDLLKRGKIEAELNHFTRKFNDPVYQTYKFPTSQKGFKTRFKDMLVYFYSRYNKGEKGLLRLRTKMQNSERKGTLYQVSKDVLEKEKPDFIFCTNQRPVNAIAPLTAAKDLGIPTGTFIFSWDNLPKATMVIEPDFYFVWSTHMKNELLNYYAFIKPKNIHITGSPQFEPHFNISLRKSRTAFFAENGLDPEKEYICFSGDDKTTSPDDPEYLKDIATAIRHLNTTEYNLAILFRRCPTDLSDRYNKVLIENKDVIHSLAPEWINEGDRWNAIMPTPEDLELQVNTILHTKAVVNVGSSMIFDYAVYEKPCLFIKYDTCNKQDETWSTEKIYNFVHFRTMPLGAVIWLKSKDEVKEKLKLALDNSAQTVEKAHEWFERINSHPPQNASERIWQYIEKSIK